jgi:hypothetical protein
VLRATLPQVLAAHLLSYLALADVGRLYWCAPRTVGAFLQRVRAICIEPLGDCTKRACRRGVTCDSDTLLGAKLAVGLCTNLAELRLAWGPVSPAPPCAALVRLIRRNGTTLQRVDLDQRLHVNRRVALCVAACCPRVANVTLPAAATDGAFLDEMLEKLTESRPSGVVRDLRTAASTVALGTVESCGWTSLTSIHVAGFLSPFHLVRLLRSCSQLTALVCGVVHRDDDLRVPDPLELDDTPSTSSADGLCKLGDMDSVAAAADVIHLATRRNTVAAVHVAPLLCIRQQCRRMLSWTSRATQLVTLELRVGAKGARAEEGREPSDNRDGGGGSSGGQRAKQPHGQQSSPPGRRSSPTGDGEAYEWHHASLTALTFEFMLQKPWLRIEPCAPKLRTLHARGVDPGFVASAMRHAPLLEVATAKTLGRLQCRSIASSSSSSSSLSPSSSRAIFVALDGSRLREFVFEVGQSQLALATATIAALAPQWPHLEHMRAAVHWRASSSCRDLIAVVRHCVRLRTLDVAGLNDERDPEKIVGARQEGAAPIADTRADPHADPRTDTHADMHTDTHASTSSVARFEAHNLCEISLRMTPRIDTGAFWRALRLPRLRHLPVTVPFDCTEMLRACATSEEMDRDAPAKMRLDARTRCEARRGDEPSIGVSHLVGNVVDNDSDDDDDDDDVDDDAGDGNGNDERKSRGRNRATAAVFSWFPTLASIEFRGSDVACLAALRVASEIQPPLSRLARIGIDLDGALGADCVKQLTKILATLPNCCARVRCATVTAVARVALSLSRVDVELRSRRGSSGGGGGLALAIF